MKSEAVRALSGAVSREGPSRCNQQEISRPLASHAPSHLLHPPSLLPLRLNLIQNMPSSPSPSPFPGSTDHSETSPTNTSAPQSAAPAASTDSDGLGDMSAFPDISNPSGNSAGNNVRVTGAAGLGEDEDMEKFESSFPDLSGEIGGEAVSCSSRV